MKNKKIIIFITLLISIFLFPNITDAADGKLKPGDIEMECVYDNGMSISVYYSGDAYSMSSSTFKVADKIQFPYSASFTIFYKEGEWAKEIIQSGTCPTYIYQKVLEQSDGETEVTFQVIYRHSDTEKLGAGNKNGDRDFMCSQIIAGIEPEAVYDYGDSGMWCADNVFFKVDPDSSIGRRGSVYLTGDKTRWTAFWFALKSERFYLNGDAQPAKQFAFKSEGKQAASNPNYITISEYYTENGNKIHLVKKDQTITKLATIYEWEELDNTKTTRYICFKPSVKEIVSDKNDMSYKFSSIRSDISQSTKYSANWSNAFRNPEAYSAEEYKKIIGNTKMIECESGYSLYGEVSLAEAEDEMKVGTSICDVLPETSIILAAGIQYLGYIVPVILIILTAIDISKIVLSGDLEEELPKKRKLIITRCIVAIAFFFVPILIKIFVSSNYEINNVDLGDISCLYDN